MDIREDKIKNKKNKPVKIAEFGTEFTDYMFSMDYNVTKGWYNQRIVKNDSFLISPAACVLHYGQGIFEGLKAYRSDNDQIYLFRARDNFSRFNSSAKRVCMPEINIDEVIEGLKRLLEIEKDWIPTEAGTSLYIRPIMFATEPFLGVRPSKEYKFMIVLSPVGAYYGEGLQAIKIMVEDFYVRATKGGLGEAKTLANYAASILAGEEAKKKGFSQVLWLDGIERKYVEEVGTMNIFFKAEGNIFTPELNGSILRGITRDSVIKLLQSWNTPVTERRISIDEISSMYSEGKLEEVFGTGTAAVISPVGLLNYRNQNMLIADYHENSLAIKLYKTLTGIQYGMLEDSFGWREAL